MKKVKKTVNEHRDPAYADYLNEEQRDAVKYCSEHGHQWVTRPGPACPAETYCGCCGAPRWSVSVEAGGWKFDPLRDAIIRVHAMATEAWVQSDAEKLRRIGKLLDDVIDKDKAMAEFLGREADRG